MANLFKMAVAKIMHFLSVFIISRTNKKHGLGKI